MGHAVRTHLRHRAHPVSHLTESGDLLGRGAALKHGTHLRTPVGATAIVLGGHVPPDRSGWMWDLTISDDHLTAGSSNGFDSGQRAMADSLGIRVVQGHAGMHAEEELLADNENTLWPLKRVASDNQAPLRRSTQLRRSTGPSWNRAQLTGPAHDLDTEIQMLAEALDSLTPRGVATIFGVCSRALAPLLEQVEQRSESRFTVPEFTLALDVIEAFATGSADVADHSELKGRLDLAISDDEHPWSTFAQDALICADTGLILASGGERPKGVLIQFALEPLAAVLEDRDTDIFRTYGGRYWRREVVNDPAMAMALGFLRRLITKVSQAPSVDTREFGEMVEAAAVLRPAYS